MALGTFRINDNDWDIFKRLCKDSGSSASAEIVAFIKSCNESGKVGAVTTSETCIDESLDSRLDDLQDSLDNRIELAIATAIAPIKAEIEELKKPEATAA